MNTILEGVLPIFIIGLLGALIKRKWVQSEEFWRGLEKVLYFILFPATLITFIAGANFKTSSILTLVAALAVGTIIVSAGLILYQQKHSIYGPKFTSLFQGSIRYNSYVFFSIGGALFDKEGMSIVAAVSAYMIILTNILCISVFNYYTKEKSQQNYNTFLLGTLATNPLIIASVIGMGLNYLDIHLVASVNKTLSLLSGAAFPLGCLIIGAGLHFNLKKEEVQSIVLASVLKLLGMPIVIAVLMKIFGVTGVSKYVGIIYASLPTATNAYMLSRQLGGDSELISSIITVTTVLCLVSLSFMIMIFV